MILRSVILPKMDFTVPYRTVMYCNVLAVPYTVYCLLYCTRTPAVPREGSNCRLTIFPPVVKGQTCFRTGGAFFLFVRFFYFFSKKRNNPHTDKPIPCSNQEHTQQPGTPQDSTQLTQQPGTHAEAGTHSTHNTTQHSTRHTIDATTDERSGAGLSSPHFHKPSNLTLKLYIYSLLATKLALNWYRLAKKWKGWLTGAKSLTCNPEYEIKLQNFQRVTVADHYCGCFANKWLQALQVRNWISWKSIRDITICGPILWSKNYLKYNCVIQDGVLIMIYWNRKVNSDTFYL